MNSSIIIASVASSGGDRGVPWRCYLCVCVWNAKCYTTSVNISEQIKNFMTNSHKSSFCLFIAHSNAIRFPFKIITKTTKQKKIL